MNGTGMRAPGPPALAWFIATRPKSGAEPGCIQVLPDPAPSRIKAAAAVAGWAQELGSVGVPGPPARDTPGPGRGLGRRLDHRCTCEIAARAAASQGGSLIICRLRVENAV
jgi:hypothetical protein